MGMGVTLGQVGSEALGLVTLVGLITIAASTYMITYSHQQYGVLEGALGWFERRGTRREAAVNPAAPARGHDALVFGLGRVGTAIVQRLVRRGYRVLAVDFDPEAVRRCQAQGLDASYGDALNPEFLASLPLSRAGTAISTIPMHRSGLTHQDPRLAIIDALRAHAFEGRIVVTSHHEDEAERLYRASADLILDPFEDAADRAVGLIVSGTVPVRIDRVESAG